MNIFLKKYMDFSASELLVLSVLNALYNSKQDKLITSIDDMFYFVYDRFCDRKKDKTIMGYIRQGIEILKKKGLIEVIDQQKDMYVFSSKGLTIDTDKGFFTIVEDWELKKIFQYAKKPLQVYELFVLLVGSINNQTKEYHMTQDTMIDYLGGSKSTLNDYLRQLEELELIYIYRPGKRRNDGTFQNVNNVYGRFKDKKAIRSSALEYMDKIDVIEFNKNMDRRSIKLRYNHFCNGSAKYKKEEEVKALYQDCIKYNKSLDISGGYGSKLDLSVFPENVTNEEEKRFDIDDFFEELDIDEEVVEVDPEDEW